MERYSDFRNSEVCALAQTRSDWKSLADPMRVCPIGIKLIQELRGLVESCGDFPSMNFLSFGVY
jgi:hypothetical protein